MTPIIFQVRHDSGAELAHSTVSKTALQKPSATSNHLPVEERRPRVVHSESPNWSVVARLGEFGATEKRIFIFAVVFKRYTWISEIRLDDGVIRGKKLEPCNSLLKSKIAQSEKMRLR